MKNIKISIISSLFLLVSCGGANYIGAQPTKPAKASIIHGELTGD